MNQYKDIYASWQANREGFWEEAAREIDWIKPAQKPFDKDAGDYGRWFVGAECNTCYNCIDRHISAGRGEQAAIIFNSPITGAKKTLTYNAMLEEVTALAAVAECAVLGISDKLKGQVPIGFVIAKDGVNLRATQLQSECVDHVRREIGAAAALRKLMQVARLPNTRAGKILRGTIHKIADGEEWTMPATVDDPQIFGEIEQAMRDHSILDAN